MHRKIASFSRELHKLAYQEVVLDALRDELAKIAAHKEAGLVSGIGQALRSGASALGRGVAGGKSLGNVVSRTGQAAKAGYGRGADLMRGMEGPMTAKMMGQNRLNTLVGGAALGTAGLGAAYGAHRMGQ